MDKIYNITCRYRRDYCSETVACTDMNSACQRQIPLDHFAKFPLEYVRIYLRATDARDR